jgi:hypothetical protein
VLDSSVHRIASELGPDDVVLDIGGAGRPFNRADWILDLLPYEERGFLGHQGPDEERFTRDSWIQRDICDHTPYPFADKQIDFVICSHTLEDVRDPIWICSELNRIAKRGYIEVPSRLEEQSWGVHGPWTGWSHHRWFTDPVDGGLRFTMKPYLLNREADHFPEGFHAQLTEDEKVVRLWWDGSFSYEEKYFYDPVEFDEYVQGFVRDEMARRGVTRPTKARRRLARLRRALPI